MNSIYHYFLVHSMRNSQHGKETQNAYSQSVFSPNPVKTHLLKLKFSFSLLLSRKELFICFLARKYSEVGKFIYNGGILFYGK